MQAILAATLQAAADASLSPAARAWRAEREAIAADVKEARALHARLGEAWREVDPLERDVAARRQQCSRAEATLTELFRPLGAAAIEARLKDETSDQPLFAARMQAHERVQQLRMQIAQLEPAASASLIDKTKAKAQQLALAGKVKLEELAFGGQEKAIGEQLIATGREESVRCGATAGVLTQVAARRAEIASSREQLARQEAALAETKARLASQLTLPPIPDGKMLVAEVARAESRVTQGEKSLAALDRELPDRLLAECAGGFPGAGGELAAALARLQAIRGQLPATTVGGSATAAAANVAANVAAHVSAGMTTAMASVQSMSASPSLDSVRKMPRSRLLIGGCIAAAALLAMVGAGRRFIGGRGDSAADASTAQAGPTGGQGGPASRGGDAPSPFVADLKKASPPRPAIAAPRVAAGKNKGVQAKRAAYLTAREKLAELGSDNPRVRIIGEIRDRAGDALLIYGTAVPVEQTNVNAEGVQLEKTNILVLDADPRAIVLNFYQGGTHYYVGRSSGKNAFGSKVPIFSYGGAPARIKEQAAAVDRAYSEYEKARRDVVAAAFSTGSRAAGNVTETTERLKQGLTALRHLGSPYSGLVGEPRDVVPPTAAARIAERGDVFYLLQPDKGTVVLADKQRVLAVTFLLEAAALSEYFSFPQSFELKAAAPHAVPSDAPWLAAALGNLGWRAGNSASRRQTELIDVYLEDAASDPELDDFHLLCLYDGRRLHALAATVYNEAVCGFSADLLPFLATNADRDPLLGETLSAGFRPTPRAEPLPPIEYRGWVESLKGQGIAARDVATSGNDQRAVTADEDGKVRLWHVRSQALLHTFEAHSGPATAVAYAAAAEVMVSGGDDGTVKVWSAESRTPLHSFAAHKEGVLDVAIAADGTRAVSGGKDREIHVWDLRSGKKLRSLTAQPDWVTCVAIAPDGGRALSGGRDGSAIVWDVASGAEKKRFEQHRGGLRTIALLADGQHAVSAGEDRVVMMWSLDSGELVRKFTGVHDVNRGSAAEDDTAIVSLATGAGTRFVSGNASGVTFVWNAEYPRQEHFFSHRARDYRNSRGLQAVSVSPHGRRVFVAYGDADVAVHPLPKPSAAGDVRVGELATFGEGVYGGIGTIALAADGKSVAFSTRESSGHNVCVGDVASGKEIHRVKLKDSPSRVVISPDLRFAASFNEFDRWINLWNVVESVAVAQLKPQRGSDDGYNGLTSPRFSPDGKFLYCVDSSYRDTPVCDLVQFECASGKEVRRFGIHQPGDEGYGAPRMHLSADGSRAFCVHPKGTAVWDVASGKSVVAAPYGIEPDGKWSLLCPPTPDGRAIVVSAGGKLHVWHVDDNTLSPELDTKGKGFSLSPDGRLVVQFGGRSHDILLFDAKTGRTRGKLGGHHNIIHGAEFTQDSRRLISAGSDGVLTVWDLNTGKEMTSFRPDARSIEQVRVAPDGRLAATSDINGHVRVWGLPATP